MTTCLIEVCANSIASALAAQEGGALRVELCDNIPEGGTTPSYGCIAETRRLLNIKLHVLIRPRGGDFCYTDEEFVVMKKDILMAKDLGADGVVFGLLKPDGTVDRDRSAALLNLAGPLSATFHRAFDMTRDPFEALDAIMDMGFDRLLTSGQKPKATDGAALIAGLIRHAAGRIVIMPGSGIDETNIKAMKDMTGAWEFHVSARRKVESPMTFRRENLSMGGVTAAHEFSRMNTDAERVRRLVELVNR
jgi:copper homeostasis protein